MIDRNPVDEQFEVTCDRCPDAYETFPISMGWHRMIEQLKSEGWLIKPDAEGNWEHICPDGCAEDEEDDDEQL